MFFSISKPTVDLSKRTYLNKKPVLKEKGMKFAYIYILMLSLAVGCQNDKNDITTDTKIYIELNKWKRLKLSEFINSIELIPLETKPENLIGEVNKIICHNNKYYIHATTGYQNGKVFVFNNTGVFLYSIDRRGEGPGEYYDLEDFCISDNNEIKLISYRKITTTSLDGSFLYDTKVPVGIRESLSRHDGNLIATSRETRLTDPNLLILMNEKGEVSDTFFPVKENYRTVNDTNKNLSSLFLDGDTVCVNNPYGHCIYKFFDKSLVGKIEINYMGKMIPEDFFEKDDDVVKQDKKLKRLRDYGCLRSFGIADDYIYLTSTDKEFNGYFSLYSKNSGKVVTAQAIEDDLFFKGNLVKLKYKNLPHNMDGNEILWVLEPFDLIEGYDNYRSALSDPEFLEFKNKYPQLDKICSSLKEDDNPVILRIKIKI